MRRILVTLAFAILCPALFAQQALNNEGVLKLIKAGLSEDLIISTINASPAAYDTSADAIVALKAAGVSDKLLAAILVRSSAPTSPVAATAAATATAGSANPDDPASPHEAGIYVYNPTAAAGQKMVMLEPNVYTQGKTGGMFATAMTYGIAKMKMKAVLRGWHANARIADQQPVFYFYFEEKGAGLSHASSVFGGTSTPNEYTLLKFDVKGETRETVIGKMNAFGASGGTDDKAVVQFSYKKISPGVYKVSLNNPLQPGEYGFISSGGSVAVGPMGSTTNSRVFDFGRN